MSMADPTDEEPQIWGYREPNRQEALTVNEWKLREAQMAGHLDELEFLTKAAQDSDALRWVALARTHMEIAFMFATKAITRPENSIGRKPRSTGY